MNAEHLVAWASGCSSMGLCRLAAALGMLAPAVSAQESAAVWALPPPCIGTPDGSKLVTDPRACIMGVSDKIRVEAFRDGCFFSPESIRPDGRITVSPIGDVQAAGLTSGQLTAILNEKIARFVNIPNAKVWVNSAALKTYWSKYAMTALTTIPEARESP